MESVNAHLGLIREKFRPYSARIQELYDTDPDFQSLCADYFLCIRFLEEHQNQPGEEQNLVNEYVDISRILEKDLFDFISQPV